MYDQFLYLTNTINYANIYTQKLWECPKSKPQDDLMKGSRKMATNTTMVSLSQILAEVGFVCVLNTHERLRGSVIKQKVERGRPLSTDGNQGIRVVYDEEGKPWVIWVRYLSSDGSQRLADYEAQHGELSRGCRVPHSNDGGWFAHEVLDYRLPIQP